MKMALLLIVSTGPNRILHGLDFRQDSGKDTAHPADPAGFHPFSMAFRGFGSIRNTDQQNNRKIKCQNHLRHAASATDGHLPEILDAFYGKHRECGVFGEDRCSGARQFSRPLFNTGGLPRCSSFFWYSETAPQRYQACFPLLRNLSHASQRYPPVWFLCSNAQVICGPGSCQSAACGVHRSR
jgi:hypothetical protein